MNAPRRAPQQADAGGQPRAARVEGDAGAGRPELLAELLDRLLSRCLSAGASDLHLTQGQRPRLRVDGALRELADEPAFAPGALEALAAAVLAPAQREALAARGSVDLARSVGAARYRLNVFTEQGRVALAARRLDEQVRSLDELRLPGGLERLTELDDGLVLVCGATGSGKTTTLATLIDRVNRARDCHILTLEDPVEVLHPSKRALVHQRELHTDFRGFAQALRAAMREDPDVILVGEMRDRPTMRAALQAAETGHLVFSTLHAGGAVGATERMIGAFAAEERDSIRHQLALVLRAVVAQRLLPGKGGRGRVPAVELLWMTPAAANLLRSERPAQLHSVMESQSALGMQTLEASLAELVGQGLVEHEVARRVARDPATFEERLRLRLSAPPRGSGHLLTGGRS